MGSMNKEEIIDFIDEEISSCKYHSNPEKIALNTLERYLEKDCNLDVSLERVIVFESDNGKYYHIKWNPEYTFNQILGEPNANLVSAYIGIREYDQRGTGNIRTHKFQ